MIPTLLMLNPGVLTSPAKVRIAPMTSRKMLAPMLIALPPWTRRGDGRRRPRRRDRYGPAPWVPPDGLLTPRGSAGGRAERADRFADVPSGGEQRQHRRGDTGVHVAPHLLPAAPRRAVHHQLVNHLVRD